MGRKRIEVVCLALLVGILAGCSHNTEPDESSQTLTIEETSVPHGWNTKWLVYWDMDFEGELGESESNPDNLCLFSCFFDESGDIYYPDEFAELREKTADMPGIHYLSVTNDLIHLQSGQIIQKDVGVLERFFADEESMSVCAEMLLDAAEDFAGLEVDFENIKRSELWESYSVFLNILSRKAEKCGKKVRIVLPCSAPVDTADLPDSFAYSVMCYNLYGTHSGPGPKADRAFLEKTAAKFRDVPNISFALATGGFVWDSDGNVLRSLTQQDAEVIRAENGIDALRDSESGALYFTYLDKGERFTVWYADSQTLDIWKTTITNAVGKNVQFDLWRVGGNIL